MSKRHPKIDKGLSKQTNLFDSGVSEVEGALDIYLGLKQLMSSLISASGQDRYSISAGISRLTTRDCSKEMLDKLTSSDPAYEPGIIRMAVFCQMVGSLEPFSYVLERLGAEVVTANEMKYLKLARLEEQRRQLEAEILQVRAQCGIK